MGDIECSSYVDQWNGRLFLHDNLQNLTIQKEEERHILQAQQTFTFKSPEPVSCC